MLATDEKVTDYDPMTAAINPPERTYDLFGLVEINAWACHLEKGHGKVAFDPTNPNHKRLTAVDVYIQPLNEITVKYPKTCEDHWVAEFPTWAKITLPSIRAALPSFGSLRDINGKWARVARVDSLDKPFERKDAAGNGTGEQVTKKTMKFVEFYNSEEECRTAAIAAHAFEPGNGSTPEPTPAPVVDPNEQARKTAEQFLKVIVSGAARGKNLTDATEAVTKALTAQPVVNKFFTIDSPEVTKLILDNAEAV